MNESQLSGAQDFVDDHTEFNREEIQLKLNKVDILEKEIEKLKTEIIILNKRMKQCWEQVEKCGQK